MTVIEQTEPVRAGMWCGAFRVGLGGIAQP